MVKSKKDKRLRVRLGIRKKIIGNSEIPRLAVFRSNKQIYAQLIDDNEGHTLASASSRDKSIEEKNIPKIDKAKLVGELLAKNAIKLGIERVVFDRGGFIFHGRVKALADAARESGLKF